MMKLATRFGKFLSRFSHVALWGMCFAFCLFFLHPIGYIIAHVTMSKGNPMDWGEVALGVFLSMPKMALIMLPGLGIGIIVFMIIVGVYSKEKQ